MKDLYELVFYVAVCAGMAMGTSSFLIIAGAFEALSVAYVVAAILVAMTFCMLISFPIAEMASMFPSSPGVRTYVRQAYGDAFSLFVVFLYLIFVLIAAGAESYMFAYVVEQVIPGVSMWISALGLIGGVAIVNFIGVTPSRGTQIGTTVVLSLAVLGLGVAALAASGPEARPATAEAAAALAPASGTLGSLAAVPAVTGICVFLFIGFEWVTPLGFGPSAYARRIPLAMPTGIALNGFLYVVFVAGAASLLSGREIAATPAPQLPLARLLLGAPGSYAALLLCVLATTSTFNAGVMGGARLVYALGRERRLPAWCAHFDAERGVPKGAIALLAVLASLTTTIIIAWRAQLAAAILASTLVCSVYAALLLAARRLRKIQPKRRRSFRAAFGESAMLVLGVSVLGLGLASVAADPRLAPQIAAWAAACFAAAGLLARWSLSTVRRGELAVPGEPKAIQE